VATLTIPRVDLEYEPAPDELERANERLEGALAERDRLRARYEKMIGTPRELSAYAELLAASEHAEACSRWCAWVDDDRHLVPYSDPRPEVLLAGLLQL
jgi:hypothetical protein